MLLHHLQKIKMDNKNEIDNQNLKALKYFY